MKSLSFKPLTDHVRLAIAGLCPAAILVAAALPFQAEAQVVRHTAVRTGNGAVHSRTVIVDRSRAGWWHGHPSFVHYHGPRAGYYFAPGHGYYAIPRAYVHTTWVVGHTLPVPMRRYVVINPVGFGLAPPPTGHGWFYAGTNFVLIRMSSGVIVQSVAGGW